MAHGMCFASRVGIKDTCEELFYAYIEVDVYHIQRIIQSKLALERVPVLGGTLRLYP